MQVLLAVRAQAIKNYLNDFSSQILLKVDVSTLTCALLFHICEEFQISSSMKVLRKIYFLDKQYCNLEWRMFINLIS